MVVRLQVGEGKVSGYVMVDQDNCGGVLLLVVQKELDGLIVWVVEDDLELFDLMFDDLQWCGVQVCGFGSVEVFYCVLLYDCCDIVVFDVGLFGEDGYVVVSYLCQVGDIGIVMLIGCGSVYDMVYGLIQGVDVYLVKLLDLDVLVVGLFSLCCCLFVFCFVMLLIMDVQQVW